MWYLVGGDGNNDGPSQGLANSLSTPHSIGPANNYRRGPSGVDADGLGDADGAASLGNRGCKGAQPCWATVRDSRRQGKQRKLRATQGDLQLDSEGSAIGLTHQLSTGLVTIQRAWEVSYV